MSKPALVLEVLAADDIHRDRRVLDGARQRTGTDHHHFLDRHLHDVGRYLRVAGDRCSDQRDEDCAYA